MEAYKHTVQYYETDMMGFAHHSNYVRWMEEARVDFLNQLSLDYPKMEKEGVISPTIEVSCKYRKSTTFSDDVYISVSIKEFKGVKLKFSYEMKNANGEAVAEAESVHCFINRQGKPIRLAKEYPEYYATIMANIAADLSTEPVAEEVFEKEDLYEYEKEEKLLDFLNQYVTRSKGILKENLVGIYLHGSAVMGCYNPEKSDIDLVIVVNEKMTNESKRAYMDMVAELNALVPGKGIEMSVVTKDVCKPFVYPTPFELHFSEKHLKWFKDDPDDYVKKMNGDDRDLAAHFTIIGKRGECLCGAPIEEVFGEVPKADYMDSIWGDVADAKNEIEDNTMYITLNLARVLAFFEEGLILSKKEGGDWGLRNLPELYRFLIWKALSEYTAGLHQSYDVELAKQFAEYMLDRIKRAEK